jgi:hypothetical protein
MDNYKLCQHCKESKSIEEFGLYKKYKDGRNVICKKCNVSKLKKYRETEKYKLYISEYYKKENISKRQKEYMSQYNKDNKDNLKVQKEEWRKINKEKIKTQKRKWNKLQKEINVLYNLSQLISSSFRKSFKRSGFSKKSKSIEILGYSFEEFKLYLESKFEPWMTWENKGLYNGELNYGWDIDHIIPISSAITEEEIIKLNHYTNLQPLCSKVNRDIKKDNYENCQDI